jgi:hypothetical protein
MHAGNRGSRSCPVLVSRQLLGGIESRVWTLFSKLIMHQEEPSHMRTVPANSARVLCNNVSVVMLHPLELPGVLVLPRS